MENFDIHQTWLVRINDNYQQQNQIINSKDAKFFNTSILIDFARLTQKHSFNCDICQKNKEIIEKLSNSIANLLQTYEGRKQLSNQFATIEKHLRKSHKMFIRRYTTSLYTSVGIAIGLLIGIVAGLITNNLLFYITIVTTCGIFVGTIVGSIKERQLIKNEQIYGKY